MTNSLTTKKFFKPCNFNIVNQLSAPNCQMVLMPTVKNPRLTSRIPNFYILANEDTKLPNGTYAHS